MAQYEEYAQVAIDVNGKEARDTLEELKKEAEGLRKQFDEAFKVGDKKKQDELHKQIQANDAAQKSCLATTDRLKNALLQMDKAAPKELSRTIKQLQKQLNSGFIQRGTKEWEAQVKVIAQLKEELRKIKEEQKYSEPQGWFSRLKEGTKDLLGLYVAGRDVIRRFYSTIQGSIDDLSAKQESAANLKALTGLDDQSIQWLTAQAEKIATTMDKTGLRVTQSSKEILEAYMLVGSAKPELLMDAEALNAVTVEAMRLASAAKMDLKEAVDAVTLSLNQYGQDASQAARFTNILAAGSKAGAAGVVEQTAAIVKSGVAVAGANVSFEQHVGLIETLAEKGVKAEVAGTALKAIFLKLAAGANDTNPAIVGLDKALENLAAKNLTVTELTKLFGESAVSAAQILIDNTDKVKSYTAAVTATNTATEQAAINSNTYAARAAQARNAISELGMKLAAGVLPAIEAFNTGLTKAAPTILTIFSILGKLLPVIIATTTAVTLYTARVKIATAATAAWNAVTSLSPMGIFAKAIGLVVGAITLFATKASAAVEETAKLNAATRNLTTTENASVRVQKAAADSAQNEITKIKQLREVINDNTASLKEKQAAIAALQRMVPDYHAALDREGKLIHENTKAVDEYIKKIVSRSLAKAYEDEITDVQRRIAKAQIDLKKAQKNEEQAGQEYFNMMEGAGSLPYKEYSRREKELTEAMDQRASETEEARKALEKEQQDLQEIEEMMTDNSDVRNAIIAQLTGGSPASPANENKDKHKSSDPLKQQLADLDKAAELLQNLANIQRRNGAMTEQQYATELLRINVALYTKKRDLYQKDSAEWVKWESKRLDEEKKISDQLAQELTKQGAEHLAEETRRRSKVEQLRRQYDSAAVARQEGEAELAVLESLHAQGLLEEEEYQRMRLAIRKKYSADGKKEQSPFSLQHADDAFGLSGTFAQLAQTVAAARTAQEEIARLEAEGEITHEQAAERRKAIDDNMWQNYAAQAQAAFSMVGSLMNAASSLMQANQDLELAKVEARYAKEIEAAGNSTKKREQLEKKKAAEEAAIKKKYNDRAMKIEIAQAIAQTAQAAIAAYASAAAIPVTGWIMAPIAAALATAAGAIQIATIRKQHAAQAAGYYEGGFTGGRRYRREAGVVHEGEFVANHQAVENPALNPIFELIDQAQRHNTVAALTPEDIALAAAAPLVRAAQAAPPPAAASTVQSLPAATSVSMDPRHTAALDRLAEQLSRPIRAVVTIDGPDGVKHNLDLYNKLQDNK